MEENKQNTDWTELKGKIKTKWSKLADSDVDGFKGNLDLIADKIQTTYGYTKDKAHQEYSDFKKSLEPTVSADEKAKPN